MEIRQEDRDRVILIRLSGALEMMSVDSLRDDVRRCIEQGRSQIALDMNSVPFIDSSGFGFLINTVSELRSAGGDLRLFGLQSIVQKVFRLSRLDARIPVAGSEREAVQSFTAMAAR